MARQVRQLDMGGEIRMREGVAYTASNARNALPIFRGRAVPDASCIVRRGDSVEVKQFLRNEEGAFFLDAGGENVASRRVVVDAKHFKLKTHTPRRPRQEAATADAIDIIDQQYSQR